MQENFVIPMICVKPPLVAYLERNRLFNIDEIVLGYVKIVMESPVLVFSILNKRRRLRHFYQSWDQGTILSWDNANGNCGRSFTASRWYVAMLARNNRLVRIRFIKIIVLSFKISWTY